MCELSSHLLGFKTKSSHRTHIIRACDEHIEFRPVENTICLVLSHHMHDVFIFFRGLPL